MSIDISNAHCGPRKTFFVDGPLLFEGRERISDQTVARTIVCRIERCRFRRIRASFG
jgi:hypothetical protein